MKLNVLTAAVLTTLASGSVLAASEGGDTWSSVQAVQQSTYSGLPSAPRPDVAFQGFENSAASGTGSTDMWSNDFRGLVGESPSTIVSVEQQ